ncbi:MAG: hypothetical protein MdMp014T_1153 [Treponematales bacterium]
MTQRLMSEDEKVAVMRKVFALQDAGKEEEAMALRKTVPMLPWLAKFAKDNGWAEYLDGWNLAEAEAEFGQGWLNR